MVSAASILLVLCGCAWFACALLVVRDPLDVRAFMWLRYIEWTSGVAYVAWAIAVVCTIL
jgi:hypothetical protein